MLVGREPRDRVRITPLASVEAELPYDAAAWKDPPPPPQYTGGNLAWHLRSNPPSDEVAGYLAQFARIPNGEQQALLHYLHMHPRPEMLDPLLSARAAVPRTTFQIGAYTRALSSTALAARAKVVDGDRELAERVKEACLAALAMHRELIVATGRDTDRGSWAALRRQIGEKWCVAVPGFLSLPEAQDDIEAIRTILETQLETAWSPNGSYAGDDAALVLVLSIGDADTLDALLRLLDHWDIARIRLGGSLRSRKDVSALSMIGQAIAERGSAVQVTAWAWWIIDRKERGDPDARELRVLAAYATALAKDARVALGARERLRASFGLRPGDEGGGR